MATLFRIVLFTLALCCFGNTGYCQDPSSTEAPSGSANPSVLRIGIVGGLQSNTHSGYLNTSDQRYPCCGFEGGSGWGGAAGIAAVYMLSDAFSISAHLTFESLGADFTRQELFPVILPNNQIGTGTFENELQVDMSAISVNLMLRFALMETPLYIAAGPTLTSIVDVKFRHTETILSPDAAYFSDGTRTHTLLDKDPGFLNGMFFAMTGAVGYSLAITDRITINPEATYSIPLTKLTDEFTWKLSRAGLRVGVLFGL